MARASPKPTAIIRAKHNKSRRACTTCKIRRIRCDEHIPHCRNCASSGRVCDGVSATQFTFVAPKTVKQKTPSPDRLQAQLSLLQHADDERRSFNFFLVKVAPLFAVGSLDAAFWCRLIPQLSREHLSVWDAVVSIALLFEHPFRPDNHSDDIDPNRKVNQHQLRAIKWYSRAVTRVAQRKDLGADDEVSALLTCVLFISLELQQGNRHQSRLLVEKGLELLFTILQNPAAAERSPESRAIAETVIPFFSRHAVFMASLGLPLMSGWPIAGEFDATIRSEQAALESLESLSRQLQNLIYQGHHLIRSSLLILHDTQEVLRMQMANRQQALLTELKSDWNHRFSAAASRQNPKHAWMCSSLEMYFLLTYTWVSTCLSKEQTSFDAHRKAFEQIISHATSILSTEFPPLMPGDTPEARSTSHKIRCIPPLYFTAVKCRDPTLRRQALNIIRQIPKGDSIWAKIETQGILESIIAFEETTTTFNPNPLSQAVPAEHRRVHHIQLLAQSELIRLFTYARGHPSNPKHIQTHVVSLKKFDASGGIPAEDFSRFMPGHFFSAFAPPETPSDLSAELEASGEAYRTVSALLTP